MGPEVHDELFGLLCVEQQVVDVTSFGQTIPLLSVVGLIAVFEEADNRGIICKLNDAVGIIAVMGEEEVEEGNNHTALWYTGIYSDGR